MSMERLEELRGKKRLAELRAKRDAANGVTQDAKPDTTISDSILTYANRAAFGFADNVAGGLEAAGSLVGKRGLGGSFGDLRDETPEEAEQSLGDVYEQGKLERRQAYEEAEKNSPKAALGMGILAAVTSPVNKIPGANTLKGIVAQGAVQGAGDSKTDTLTGMAKDAALGGVVAGGFGAGLKGAGKLISKLPAGITGIGDDTAKYYMANHDAVDAARPIKDISDDFISSVGNYKRQLSNESTEGFEALKNSGRDISPDELASIVTQQTEKQGTAAITSKAKSLVSELSALEKEIKEAGGDEGRIPYDKIKSYIKQLDDEIDWEAVSFGRASARDRSYRNIRDGLDRVIKQVPEYSEIMKNLAGKSAALEDLGSGLKNEKTVDSMLNRISKGKDARGQEALAGLDEKMGSNYSKELRDSSTRELFTKENSRGSRNTIVAGGAATLLGSMFGVPPWISAPVGAAAGPVVDKHGREIYRKMLKAAAEHPEAISKFQKVLDKAAMSGPASLVTAHRLLMNKEPAYQKAMGDDQ